MLVPALVFIASVAAALYWGRAAMRLLVAAAILLAAVRGGLLVLAGDIGLSDPGLSVNALVPSIVAALVIGVLVKLRPSLEDFSKPMLIGWCLIAAIALANFLIQTVGLKLYGIGLAQYLVYPTLALVVWPLMEEGDERRIARVIMAASVLVAFTVMLQATGLESFVQSANAEVDGLNANRYAGITGSYLHTSSFLGTAFVLIMGETMATGNWRNRIIGVALLAWLFSAVILTFSRSGVMISVIGAAILFIFAAGSGSRRLRLVALVIPAIVVAIGVGALGGVTPEEAAERAASGLKTEGDLGNELRSNAIRDGIERYKDETVLHQVLGNGLASTGNARQLDGGLEDSVIVESYYLKVLTETGAIGLILIGGFLIWSLVYFTWAIWRYREPRLASLAAAGIGLGLYNVIYPALETQLLALVWWMLLSMSLRNTWLRATPGTKLLFPLGRDGTAEQEPAGN